MRIAVTFCDAALTLAVLRLEPSWLERLLFGTAPLDDMIVGCTAPGGGYIWLHDSTGRRVRSKRVVDAIELARRRGLDAQHRAAI